MVRRVLVMVIAAVMFQSATLTSAAADDSVANAILVTVVDGNNSVIDRAYVTLSGPVQTAQITDASGEATFSDLPEGVYRISVRKLGFALYRSRDIALGNGSRAVRIQLKQVYYSRIGQTATRSSTPGDGFGNILTAGSPAAEGAHDIAEVLETTPGATATVDDTGETRINVEGYEQSQTSRTLNGAPVSLPGISAIPSIDKDLLASASLQTGTGGGTLGGRLALGTIQPTLDWRSGGVLRGGSSSGGFAATTQGTWRGWGIAAGLAQRGSQGTIDGATFLDSSGLVYSHNSDATNGSGLLVVRRTVGDTTLSTTALGARRTFDLTCAVISVPVPCGYGPGNLARASQRYLTLNATGPVGASSWTMGVLESSTRITTDFTHQRFGLLPVPHVGFGEADVLTAFARLTGPFGDRASYDLDLNTGAAMRGQGFSIPGISVFSSSQHVNALSSRLAVHERLGAFSVTYQALLLRYQTSAGNLFGVGASVPLAPGTTLAAEALGGATPNTAIATVPLTQPATLAFDCGVGHARGSLAGDQGGSTRVSAARLSANFRSRAWRGAVTVYHSLERGLVLPLWVNGTASSDLSFPSYVDDVNTAYHRLGGCSGTLKPEDLLFIRSSPSRRRVQGSRIEMRYTPSRKVGVGAYVATQSVTIDASSLLFSAPESFYGPHLQFVDVPLHRAGSTIYVHLWPSSQFSALIDYVGPGNSSHIAAYTTVGASLSFSAGSGKLTVAGRNLTGVYSPALVSADDAMPAPTLGGSPIRLLPRPLPPRSVELAYAFSMSRKGGAPAFPQSERVDREAATFGQPASSFNIPYSVALPITAPDKPLQLDPTRPQCTAMFYRSARDVVDVLSPLVTEMDNMASQAALPEEREIVGSRAVSISYHKLEQRSYALAVMPHRPDILPSLVACGYVHIASQQQLRERSLYEGTAQSTALVYSPATGFYIPYLQSRAGREDFRVYRVPAVPPQEPFRVSQTKECTGDSRAVASDLLGQLARSRELGLGDRSADAWSIERLSASSVALKPSSSALVPAILACARIVSATPEELHALGIVGRPAPWLNFAPRVGLFVVKQP